jgi:hypothetical protein
MKRKGLLSVQICGYSARNEAVPDSPAFGSPVGLSRRSHQRPPERNVPSLCGQNGVAG